MGQVTVSTRDGVTYTVTETFTGRDLSVALGRERDYTRPFYVTTSAVVDGSDVYFADGVPRLGDHYVNYKGVRDVDATCRRVRIRQRDEDPKQWRVEAEYSTRAESLPNQGGLGNTGGSPAEAKIENPTLRPAKISFGSVRVREVVTEDADGEHVQNSAGDPFDPPLEQEKSRLTIHITKNVIGFVPALIELYENTINKDEFLGFQAHDLLCTSIRADSQYEAGLSFMQVSVDFEVNRDGWVRRVLDAGFKDINNDAIRDPNGQPVRTPALLDGNGLPLPHGADPVFLNFQLFEERDFSGLNLI